MRVFSHQGEPNLGFGKRHTRSWDKIDQLPMGIKEHAQKFYELLKALEFTRELNYGAGLIVATAVIGIFYAMYQHDRGWSPYLALPLLVAGFAFGWVIGRVALWPKFQEHKRNLARLLLSLGHTSTEVFGKIREIDPAIIRRAGRILPREYLS